MREKKLDSCLVGPFAQSSIGILNKAASSINWSIEIKGQQSKMRVETLPEPGSVIYEGAPGDNVYVQIKYVYQECPLVEDCKQGNNPDCPFVARVTELLDRAPLVR